MALPNQDLLLASFALATATTTALTRTARCAERMDAAARFSGAAPSHLLAALGIEEPTAARMNALRRLASNCGSCRACPRGQVCGTSAAS